MKAEYNGREHSVGPRLGEGPSRYMVYIGVRPKLRGKTAIVCNDPPNGVCAQFDDVETGYGLGWWPFAEKDFVLHKDFYNEFRRQKETHNYSRNHAIRKTIERFSK